MDTELSLCNGQFAHISSNFRNFSLCNGNFRSDTCGSFAKFRKGLCNTPQMWPTLLPCTSGCMSTSLQPGHLPTFTIIKKYTVTPRPLNNNACDTDPWRNSELRINGKIQVLHNLVFIVTHFEINLHTFNVNRYTLTYPVSTIHLTSDYSLYMYFGHFMSDQWCLYCSIKLQYMYCSILLKAYCKIGLEIYTGSITL